MEEWKLKGTEADGGKVRAANEENNWQEKQKLEKLAFPANKSENKEVEKWKTNKKYEML